MCIYLYWWRGGLVSLMCFKGMHEALSNTEVAINPLVITSYYVYRRDNSLADRSTGKSHLPLPCNGK